MAKKAEGIRERGVGSYEINFRPYRGGNRVQKIIHAGSIAEAKVKRAEMIAAALKDKSPSEEEKNGQTFDEIWPILEKDVLSDGRKAGTMNGYKNCYKRLFTEFRDKEFPSVVTPSQITLSYLKKYKSWYGLELDRFDGLRTELKKVKSIMNRLRSLRYCSKDLIEELGEVQPPEEKKKDYPEISLTDIKKLLRRIKIERPDYYGIIYFMFRTGRRVTEVTLIERKDIEWDGFNPIKINIRAETTKTNKRAPLNYLDSDLQAHIRQYYSVSNKHQSPYLFLNKQHSRCFRNPIFNYLSVLSEEVLKVRITSHYFRHRFCTETCKARLPLVDIQAICGIRDVKILINNYCHCSTEGQASVLEKTRL